MPACSKIEELDPYTFLALAGKRVLHPGGLQSTEQMIRLAGFTAQRRVLDIGCGVGSTAMQIASRFGCHVTAVDIDRSMLDYAGANVVRAGLGKRITFMQGDMRALPFADASFDIVTIEAVTMFTGDQPRSVGEALRVCRPGGIILDHELVWLEPSHAQLQALFHREICAGAEFEMLDDWIRLYLAGGDCEISTVSIPFDMISLSGLLRDEGISGLARILLRCGTRWCYLKKMTTLTSRLLKVIPHIGTVVIAATRNWS